VVLGHRGQRGRLGAACRFDRDAQRRSRVDALDHSRLGKGLLVHQPLRDRRGAVLGDEPHLVDLAGRGRGYATHLHHGGILRRRDQERCLAPAGHVDGGLAQVACPGHLVHRIVLVGHVRAHADTAQGNGCCSSHADQPPAGARRAAPLLPALAGLRELVTLARFARRRKWNRYRSGRRGSVSSAQAVLRGQAGRKLGDDPLKQVLRRFLLCAESSRQGLPGLPDARKEGQALGFRRRGDVEVDGVAFLLRDRVQGVKFCEVNGPARGKIHRDSVTEGTRPSNAAFIHFAHLNSPPSRSSIGSVRRGCGT